MKKLSTGIAAVLLAGIASSCTGARDDAAATLSTDSVGHATSSSADSSAASPPASVPQTLIPDTFATANGGITYDARRAYDLTGDGKPETLVLHASGPTPDSATVHLAILGTAADTLYAATWHTPLYFIYTPRHDMNRASADSIVLKRLKRVLSDSSFSAQGKKPDRDAILYDLKEEIVRSKRGIGMTAPLPPGAEADLEKAVVKSADVDALVEELTGRPTFMYFAGGELTYTIAWSDARKRFVRVFSCC